MKPSRVAVGIWVAVTGLDLFALCAVGHPPLGWEALSLLARNAVWISGGHLIGTVGTRLFFAWRDSRRS